MAKRMPAAHLVAELKAALKRRDGYIMGSKGQNPKKWSKDSWWFTQYKGAERTKALYWREHAARVWDCNGLMEGIYQDFSGVNIDSKARYNYSGWCGTKGSGMIPAKYRQPGAAVFWSDDGAGSIHHVAYLIEPVKSGNPGGDWKLIEARGVNYGVVETRLLSRKPNFWGLMTKYVDYSGAVAADPPVLGSRVLKNGDEGEDVRQMQSGLIRLGYDLGRWGADGDFGDCTELAVRAFQKDNGLPETGKFDAAALSALDAALAALERTPEEPRVVRVEGGDCYVRKGPGTQYGIIGVAKRGAELPYGGQTAENGWPLVEYNGENGWVSNKYGRVI